MRMNVRGRDREGVREIESEREVREFKKERQRDQKNMLQKEKEREI